MSFQIRYGTSNYAPAGFSRDFISNSQSVADTSPAPQVTSSESSLQSALREAKFFLSKHEYVPMSSSDLQSQNQQILRLLVLLKPHLLLPPPQQHAQERASSRPPKKKKPSDTKYGNTQSKVNSLPDNYVDLIELRKVLQKAKADLKKEKEKHDASSPETYSKCVEISRQLDSLLLAKQKHFKELQRRLTITEKASTPGNQYTASMLKDKEHLRKIIRDYEHEIILAQEKLEALEKKEIELKHKLFEFEESPVIRDLKERLMKATTERKALERKATSLKSSVAEPQSFVSSSNLSGVSKEIEDDIAILKRELDEVKRNKLSRIPRRSIQRTSSIPAPIISETPSPPLPTTTVSVPLENPTPPVPAEPDIIQNIGEIPIEGETSFFAESIPDEVDQPEVQTSILPPTEEKPQIFLEEVIDENSSSQPPLNLSNRSIAIADEELSEDYAEDFEEDKSPSDHLESKRKLGGRVLLGNRSPPQYVQAAEDL
jgi:hypothetical protein